MALRKIIVDGDEILKKKCRPVETVNDRIRLILDDMVETMHEYNGVGLAAPQVGIMRRMFVAEPDDEDVMISLGTRAAISLNMWHRPPAACICLLWKL